MYIHQRILAKINYTPMLEIISHNYLYLLKNRPNIKNFHNEETQELLCNLRNCISEALEISEQEVQDDYESFAVLERQKRHDFQN